jgi:hypothetical protein
LTASAKEEDMTVKRGARATKRTKKPKDLRVRSAAAQKTRGGTPGTFEIMDFSFGVENPTTIGSGTGGASAGKSAIGEIHIKGK